MPTDHTADVLAAARTFVEAEGRALTNLVPQLDETLLDAIDLILASPGKVFVTGSGTSGAVARRMAHLLAVCGTPSVFVQPSDALHGTMGALVDGDVMIAISKGGASSEINQLVGAVRERGARCIALTSTPDSPLGAAADVVVVVQTPTGVDPGELIAMGSTLVTAAWGDALAYVLMRIRGYEWDQVMHTHPSGAVGQRRALPEPLEPLDFDRSRTSSEPASRA